MKMPEKLIITINKDGSIKVEADGFIGPVCEKEVLEFISAFGGETTHEEHKPEYYQEQETISVSGD